MSKPRPLAVLPLSRKTLLHGTSLLALLLLPTIAAEARSLGASATSSATAIAADAAAQAAAQAASAAAQGSASLSRATAALQAMQAAQAAARAAAGSAAGVPNGLTVGGLVPDSGLAAAGVARPVVSWTNARTPVQSGPTDSPTVKVQQTGAQAILNWSSFNVGASTSLVFDQQGNSSWVALNRVGASSSPSQILGNIKADGSVYIINQSGIIFGGGSQINVGSLIASAAGITDAQFLTYGIFSPQSGSYTPSFTAAGGKIVVESGVLITTAAPLAVTSGGGSVILLGTEVLNAGTITTPKGQTVLAAGDSFILRAGYSTDGNATSTTRGVEVAPVRAANSPNGAVSNSGLVFAQQGDITLAGHAVTQNGLLISTISVDQRGTIHLLNSRSDATGSVTLTGDAITAVLPELDNTATAFNSQRDALIADSAKQNANRFNAGLPQFDNLSPMNDRQDQSRIEIVSGGLVDFKPNSLTLAQGGQISTYSTTRILVETGATLDVSGTAGTVLPASANSLKINVQPNELRDSPINRDSGVLINKDVWIDARDLVLVPAGTGGYASDRYYTKGGLLEVAGYVANTGHTIGEWTAVGGTITLTAPNVTARKGALFDLSGGMVTYAAGDILTAIVIGADGRAYSIGDAPANLPIISYGSGFTREHPRWGQSETWTSPNRGATRIVHQESYSVGRDAGLLQIYAGTSEIEATIEAQVYDGERQTAARPASTADGYKLGQTQVPLAGRLGLGFYETATGIYGDARSSVVFTDAPQSAGAQGAGHVFDSAALSSYQLGGISVSTTSTIDIKGDLTLAPGGVLDLNAQGKIDVAGNLTAPAGRIALTSSGGSLTVESGVAIDTRGLWTNLSLDPLKSYGLGYLNGGAISLSATNLTLADGSSLDASAGGAILANGKTKGGDGGDITLRATGAMTLDGEFASYGFGKGGKLNIITQGPISIGGRLADGGVVAANQSFLMDLKLAKDTVFPAGSILPFATTITTPSLYLPGQTVVGTAEYRGVDRYESVLIGPGGWTVPAGSRANYTDPDTYDTTWYQAGAIIPAGTQINYIYLNAPSGFLVSASAFPNGLPAEPSTQSVAAGTPIPSAYTALAGTVIPKDTVLQQAVAVLTGPQIADAATFFSRGFSSYGLTSPGGVYVLPGASIQVTQPVFQFTTASLTAPTGSNPAIVAPVVLPPLFTEDAVRGTITQRAGADLVIGNPNDINVTPGSMNSSSASQGDFVLGRGASITVDPGRSVSVGSSGQITIDGSITARGGAITLVNNAWQPQVLSTAPYVLSGRSVWIGSEARLDVSGLAYTAFDLKGRAYGSLSAGGSVVLGALNVTPASYGLRSGNAFVVIRPGAVIDASGASATLDMLSSDNPADARLVASDGGLIALASQWGIYNDGRLNARAGGAGASGGTLVYTLETPPIALESFQDPIALLPVDARAARVITVAQTYGASSLSSNLVAGATDTGLRLGQARLGVDQIQAGGFGSLSLWARGAILFDGNVSLAMSRSVTLRQGPLMNSSATGQASVSAPYVLLDGMTVMGDDSYQSVYLPNERAAYPTGAALTISGDLVDARNRVRTTYRDTNVISSGDLRFLAATAATEVGQNGTATSGRVTTLGASGNLTLTAAQVYPASGARAVAAAGVTQTTWQGALTYGATGSVLTIRRNGDTPAMPYSLFGSLELYADNIYQGGVVRAPFGSIIVGRSDLNGGKAPTQVELLSGSITSVSTDGLVMPYGGSSDGVNYLVDGAAAVFADLGGAFALKDGTRASIGITLNGRRQTVDAGALLDLSGGGTLTGAAFLTGRGGSVDVLMTPLANANPGNTYSSARNSVYAIVPGVVTAPVTGGYNTAWTGSTPGIGQQITVPAGVPGLPAGTYTLLPASYALLPGAFRVELAATTTTRLPNVATLANGSTIVPVYRGIADTSIVNALPTQAIVTPAPTVRKYSQYQEQSYTGFVLAQAAQFGNIRYMIEADAHTLTASVRSTAADAVNSAFMFSGKADFTADTGGLSGVFVLAPARGIYDNATTDLVITGDASQAVNSANVTTVSAAAIAAVDAPNVSLGSSVYSLGSLNGNTDRNVYITAAARSLTLDANVHLTADSIFLGAVNTVTLSEGVIVSTLGHGYSWLNTATGLKLGYINGGAVLGASNDTFIIGTPTGSTTSILMKNGSGLYSEGSIGFFADRGLSTQGSIGLGTRRLALNAASLNIGTEASLAAVSSVLPAGLNLTQTFLNTLFAGGGVPGAPAVEQLTLGARNGVNFFGDVTLSTIDPATGKSRLAELVLAGPSIYGYGTSADTARIVTDTLVWQGNSQPVARIAGLGNAGAFAVDARQILFGTPSNVAPVSGANYNRLMLGFDRVQFGASERISANGSGTLSVYGSGPAVTSSFDPATYRGTGNALSLQTPLMTTESGATFSLYSNAIDVTAPAGSSAGAAGSLGGTLSINGDSLTVASAIVLPAGRLSLTARNGDLVLTDAARLDVAGHAIDFNGVLKQAWAGDILLTSQTGNVITGQGSVIDLSSEGSDAGNLTITAAGAARLAGALKGSGGGNGARDGAFNLTADSLGGDLTASFAALNQALNGSGFGYSRAFTFASGSLVVGNDVRARNVAIAVNGGSLTVAGRIDAAGRGTGSVRLSARDDVRLTGSAVLDVRGTSLVLDSYGQVIEASNRNSVEINTGAAGWLRLDAGATIDTSSPDGVARGRVDLNARRSTETGGDIQIDASGPLNLRGIGSLAVNAYWTYSPSDANGSIVQDNTTTGVPTGAVGLKQIDATNQTFYANALGNSGLQTRLTGLKTAAGAAYHLRPGVEIVSSVASGGKLTVLGDLDLAGYRYGADADRNSASVTYGFGEPLALAIRASGNLDIKGSITDGFGVPKTSPDENNFRDRTISTTSTIDMGLFPGGFTVDDGDTSHDTTAGYFDADNWWAYVYPQPMTLVHDWTNTEWTAMKDSTGRTYAPGTVVPAGTTLVGYVGGYPLHFNVGTVVPDFRLIVTTLSKGKIYAIAPMLAPGAMSASIRLVSGADLASADSRALLSATALAGVGNMTLDDYHTHTPSGSGGDNQTSQISSVIRTGTGDLDLLAGGSLVTKSLFGIYTAGTQSAPRSDDSDFTTKLPAGSLSTPALMATLNDRISYYPEHGGDLRVVVQGDYTGYQTLQTLNAGNWLIRQGANEIGQKTAWSVNFGKYYNSGSSISVDAINGFGTFGGGNAAVTIGGNAGGIAPYDYFLQKYTGLIVTVASTGRVLGGGTLVETGGGTVDIAVAGKLNEKSRGGSIVDLRGAVTLTAGQIGALSKTYNTVTIGDPRPSSPLVAGGLDNNGTFAGPGLGLGDAMATVRSRGDMNMSGAGDLGILDSATTGDIASPTTGSTVASWFSLMRASTAVDIMSLGGDLVTSIGMSPIYTAAAASGSIYYINGNGISQEPAPLAQIELLARNSIYASGQSIGGMSPADPALLPTPFHPAFVEWTNSVMSRTNTLTTYDAFTDIYTPTFGLYALAPNVATSDLHAGDPNPVRIYAVNGDIVGLQLATAKRLEMIAAGDIVLPGTSFAAGISILHADAKDVSVIQAGGKIIYPNVRIAGPGTLSMTAGGDINLADKGNIVSTGPAYAADLRPGASVALLAGAGSTGADYAAVASLYLDPANRAVSGTPLADQPGKVAKTYEAELKDWLAQRYGYATRDDADARAYFGGLKPEQQNIFLRQVYFAELKAGGREYNDASSPRYGSYLRGRQMIATLFPDRDALGGPITYDGDISIFSSVASNGFQNGGGVRTIGGGDIALLTPGGRQVIGVEGVTPPAASGLITQGAGDINLYSKGSILLGLSRIMTTFGGSILAWSAEGDINAGRGSKSTQIYTPPKRIYDKYGHVVLSPQAPSTGAGIATLNPVPGTTAGDVDLIAPEGTIDAGEAGIRVSGNINLAALQIVNAANIQVQGTSTGLPTVQGPPVAALTAANNVAGAATPAASGPSQNNDRPSIILVEFLGFGGGDGSGQPGSGNQGPKDNSREQHSYNVNSPVQLVGNGPLTEAQMSALTAEEKRNLESR
ncbi:filamentous haemagglutinin family protein [Rhodopseudomonas palustris]|nr:filamentous haemagglutinin family protein [Rhodopseudomonas palustris]